MMLQMSRCALMSIAVVLLLGPQGSAQQYTNSTTSYLEAAAPRVAMAVPETSGVRVVHPELVGTYSSDGNFALPNSRAALSREVRRSAEVPPSLSLRPNEVVIDDFEAPKRAAKPIRASSAWASLRDNIVAAAYGRDGVLAAPTHLTTDSRNRLIVADPDGSSVHVLDGKNSFRIAGGEGRRFQRPHGVAVDGQDNIYIADPERGFVLVYNAEGIFQRYIGKLGDGESIFQEPTAIAIDTSSGRLFVLDAPVNELVVLDLEGRLLKRVGGRRHAATRLDRPSEIAVKKGHIVIMDSYSSRIQILDQGFNLVSQFQFRNVVGVPIAREMGLALDSAGNIYIGGQQASQVRVFKISGEQTATLALANARGDSRIIAPTSLWIDPSDHIFVADKQNSRVQVFQKR
jgi:DNA-binding beta-propeller fold protein YncE